MLVLAPAERFRQNHGVVLNNAEMAIPSAVYGLVMLFTAAGFGWLITRRTRADATVSIRGR